MFDGIRRFIFTGIIFLYVSTNISTMDLGMIAEQKKIAVFEKAIPFLINPVDFKTLEERNDSEEILMGVIFTRYYQFWTMLSLYTCTIYYSAESPNPRSMMANVCKKWANVLHTHLSETKGKYFAFSLRKISSRQQLMEAYARKMHDIFNNAPSNTWFDCMSKITKNLDSKYAKNVRIHRSGISAEETGSEFYAEVWRRVILFYGDNLVRLESYYNSVLVDDKDISVRDLIPAFRGSVAFWENAPLSFPAEHIPDEPLARTQYVLSVVRVHEKFRMLLQHVETPSEVSAEARCYLETQPSGVSEYVYLLRETVDENDQQNSSESVVSAASSFSGRKTPTTNDFDDDAIVETFED